MFIVLCSIYLIATVAVKSQTSDDSPSFKKILSDKPSFRTQSVLTSTGYYVNSPKEDFEASGAWNLPLTLDQMNGLIGGVAFGDGDRQSQRQLGYPPKFVTQDTSRPPTPDGNPGLASPPTPSHRL